MPEPPQLVPPPCEGAVALLWVPPGASHPISNGEPRCPAQETHFNHLYPWSGFFSHHPERLTIDEGRNIDWVVHQKFFFWLRFVFITDQCKAYITGTNPPVDFLLHFSLICEQDPKIPKLPNMEKARYLFLAEDHGLRCESTDSQCRFFTLCSSKCCRSQSNDQQNNITGKK